MNKCMNIAFSSLFIFSATPVLAAEMPDRPSFTKTGETTVQAQDAISAEAEVIAIDKKTREIKLKTEDGEEMSITAAPEVKNFAQIKKGDRLKVRYLETLILDLKKGGTEPVVLTQSSDLETAKKGQKPGAVATSVITARGTVINTDAKKHTITVKGPNRTLVLPMQDKELFSKIKKGDQIEARYTEAMAISIESAKK